MKQRKRNFVQDIYMGLNPPRSIVLTTKEEAICVLFRKHTLLPLEEYLYTLQDTALSQTLIGKINV